jgi:hypothetical protein
MALKIFRLPELWNRKARLGLWRAGKTKICADYLLRDPAEPFVPGTDVRRAEITYLGPRLPVVAEAEVERLPRELGEFYANAQRLERDQALERDKVRRKHCGGPRGAGVV